MRVVQSCLGKFWYFHLARELHASGQLERIFCGYPWSRLKNEQIPRSFVGTYPWFQTIHLAQGRFPIPSLPRSLKRQLEFFAKCSFDNHVASQLPDCDSFVGLSGSTLNSGRLACRRGVKYVVDRGSSHIGYQDDILSEEHKIWGCDWEGIDPRVINREKEEYALADKICVPSQFAYDSFVSKGFPSSKLAKIPFGGDLRRFRPGLKTQNLNRFIVLFVGQVSLRKGIPYLLKAFATVKHPTIELWIVGGLVGSIGKVISKLPTDRVKFLGRVPNPELCKIYAQADVFVLPSIEEGLALVQGEALASGCPVIATKNTGADDILEHGKEGFIVPIRDAKAIAERIQQLIDDAELRNRMSIAAAKRIETIGGWCEYGKNYMKMLNDLANASTTVPVK